MRIGNRLSTATVAVALLAGLSASGAALSAEATQKEQAAEEVYKIICAKPADITQKMLCEHQDLRQLDLQIRQQLDRLVSSIPEDDERQRGQLKYSQERFAHVRRLCQGNLKCLRRIYKARLKTLKEWKTTE